MTMYAKITRDLQDTGDRRDFPEDALPPSKDSIAATKPYWVPVENVTADESQTPYTSSETVKTVEEARVLYTTTISDRAITAEMVDAERDRRLDLNFAFNGVSFQRDPVAIRRITGAGALALGAIVAGAQAGDYYWHGGADPFTWIAADNSLVQMDAQTTYAFAAAAAAIETILVFKAKALKEMEPIPADFTDDSYWV